MHRAGSDGGVVTIRYRTLDFASQSFGGYPVDYFRNEPGVYVYGALGADRLTVIGPEGTVVTSGIAGASTDGRNLTLTSFEPQGDGPFVVFGPSGDSLAAVRAGIAIAAVAIPSFLLGNPVLLLVLLVGGLAGLPVLLRATTNDD